MPARLLIEFCYIYLTKASFGWVIAQELLREIHLQSSEGNK